MSENSLPNPNMLTPANIDAMQPGREMDSWVATMLLATSMPSYHAVDMAGFAGCSTDRSAAQRLTDRLVERGWDHGLWATHEWPETGLVFYGSRFIHHGICVIGKYCRGEAAALIICRSALHAMLSQKEAREGR